MNQNKTPRRQLLDYRTIWSTLEPAQFPAIDLLTHSSRTQNHQDLKSII